MYEVQAFRSLIWQILHIKWKLSLGFIQDQNLLHLKWRWWVFVWASPHSHTKVTPADWSMYVLLGDCLAYWWPLLFWMSSHPCHPLAHDHFQLQRAGTSFSVHLRVSPALPRSLCVDHNDQFKYYVLNGLRVS